MPRSNSALNFMSEFGADLFKAPTQVGEFCIVSDDSGHDYVIPLEQRDNWEQVLDDAFSSGELPAWAVVIDGGPLVFSHWRIGSESK